MPIEEGKLFIGPNEVDHFDTIEQKTPAGKDIVKVFYKAENVLPEIMPFSTFNLLSTEEPKDWNYVRETRYKQLLLDLTALCLETDIKFCDLAYVGKGLVNKMEDAFERGANFLWTGNDKTWVSGIDHRTDLTLLQVEAVLKGIKEDGKSA